MRRKRKKQRASAIARREFLRLTGLVGTSFALSGIRMPSAFGQSRYGGTLRISVSRGLKTLNPIMHISGPEWMATKWMYNNLTRLNHRREVVPDLAESWEANENATVWTFRLKQGVQFHSGKELTAADVVATLMTVVKPEVAAPYAAELGPIKDAEAVDRYTVKITLSSPFADFPVSMTVPSARIIEKEALEGDLDLLASKEFGSGPFRLKEFVPGDHIIVERYDNYFKTGFPYLDRVELRVLPEPSAEVIALQNRETDLIWEVPSELFATVATTPGVDGLEVAGGTFSNVILPSDKPPFDDNRVREALKYTVDRDLMLAAVVGGRGEIGHDHPVSSAYRFYHKLPTRRRDIEKAKALLKEAGYADGLSLKLFVANRPAIREQIAVVLKEMAKPAGFVIEVELVSYDRYLAQIWNKGVPYVGFYGTRPTADAILMKLFHPEFGIDEGRWGGSHRQHLQLLEEARATAEDEKRRPLYARFQEIAQQEGPFVIPLFRSELSAKWNYVQDYTMNPSVYEVDLEAVWLAEKQK